MTGREMAERVIESALRAAPVEAIRQLVRQLAEPYGRIDLTRQLRRPVVVKRNDIIAFEVLPAGAPSKEELARVLYAFVLQAEPVLGAVCTVAARALLGRVPKEWLE